MHVLILTEGSLEWGVGHLYRCLCFARHFVNKGLAVEWLVNGDDRAGQFLASQAIGTGALVDWTGPGALDAYLDGCVCAIVDSYHAPRECYHRIAERVRHRVWVDDEARLVYPEGVVVNPNPLVAQRIGGGMDVPATLLSGFEYQLLREEFSQPERRGYNSDVQRVLVMMGGTDLRHLSPGVVETILATFPDVSVDVVVPSAEQRSSWSHLASAKCTLHGLMSAMEIRDLMRTADLAVTAAGQTLCEAASQGLPTLAIGVADNQRIHTEALRRMGVIRFVGWHDDPDLLSRLGEDLSHMRDVGCRRDMGEKGRSAIDGRGVHRIASVVMDWCELQQLRKAVSSDSKRVWGISNQPSVREYSISKGEIPWDEHALWFEKAITNPDLLFFVLEWDGNVVGQLRYKRMSTGVVGVSISLSQETRGNGIASRMLKEGDVRCFASWPEVTSIEAEISPYNAASMKTFLRAGYRNTDERREYADHPFDLYRKDRQDA